MRTGKLILAGILAVCMAAPASCGKKDDEGYSVAAPSEQQAVDSSETASQSGERVLIAYFSNPQTDGTDADSSASRTIVGGELRGTVEYTAMTIQSHTGGDMFRIETAEPYPADYDDTINKAKQEQRDGVRPALSSHIEDISIYDTVYLGYANWWGDLPMAVYSFLDEYDLSGKAVRIFVSHGGSGASSTISTVSSLEPDANVDSNALVINRKDIPDTESKVSEWLGG